MAQLNVLVKRPPEQVWQFLSDGWSYADWVVGTRAVRDVDEDWPAVGASLRYTLGVGPLLIEDSTTVRNAVQGRMLEMEVQAGRIGTARLHFDIRPWGEHTVVVFDEHPLSGPGAHVHNMAIDLVLRIRNRRLLDRLAFQVEQRYPVREKAPTR